MQHYCHGVRMRRAFRIRRSAVAVLAFSMLASIAETASAEMQFSGYGGVQGATGNNVTVSDGTSFDPNWSGKSFSSPPYYGFRGT
jgi:lipid A oxidase